MTEINNGICVTKRTSLPMLIHRKIYLSCITLGPGLGFQPNFLLDFGEFWRKSSNNNINIKKRLTITTPTSTTFNKSKFHHHPLLNLIVYF